MIYYFTSRARKTGQCLTKGCLLVHGFSMNKRNALQIAAKKGWSVYSFQPEELQERRLRQSMTNGVRMFERVKVGPDEDTRNGWWHFTVAAYANTFTNAYEVAAAIVAMQA